MQGGQGGTILSAAGRVQARRPCRQDVTRALDACQAAAHGSAERREWTSVRDPSELPGTDLDERTCRPWSRASSQAQIDRQKISVLIRVCAISPARSVLVAVQDLGGVRAGAGRPPKGKSAGVSHLRRPSLSPRHPLHVTLRLTSGVPSLRQQALFVRVRGALALGQERFGFRLVRTEQPSASDR
jgi:hypothetical protein